MITKKEWNESNNTQKIELLKKHRPDLIRQIHEYARKNNVQEATERFVEEIGAKNITETKNLNPKDNFMKDFR